MLTQAFTTGTNSELITDVRLGLTKPGQKELPSKYLYDSVGSALFEVISVLPEYGLTRADERLLRRHSEDIVAQTHSSDCGGRVGQRQRQEDALDARSAEPSSAHFVLPHRNFAGCAHHVRARTRRH